MEAKSFKEQINFALAKFEAELKFHGTVEVMDINVCDGYFRLYGEAKSVSGDIVVMQGEIEIWDNQKMHIFITDTHEI